MRYEYLLQRIAIPQTGIAAPTLTAMQGFEAKKKKDPCMFFPYSSILRLLTFLAFALPAGVEPGCDGYNLSAVNITLRRLHQPIGKMSYKPNV